MKHWVFMARLRYWRMYMSEVQSSEFGVITFFLNLWFTWFCSREMLWNSCVGFSLVCLIPSAAKVHFCQQLCQRTPRQLLSLELELLEIGENVRCPVPLVFRAKPTWCPPILVQQNLRRFGDFASFVGVGSTPAGPPCSGPGRVWKPSIEHLNWHDGSSKHVVIQYNIWRCIPAV